MSAEYIDLSYGQVALAAVLVLVNGVLSMVLRLGLGGQLVVASVRLSVQLIAVGFVLRWVFSLQQWYVVVALALLMTIVAGLAAVQRADHRYRGAWLTSIGSVGLASWSITAVALLAIVGVEPWYRPQYAIPLLGMIMGNALTGISLGLDRCLSILDSERGQVEAWLALGATRWEASRSAVRAAVRTGMVPTINAMMVAGIVSLPGMMTGQLLAGVDPLDAVQYQIVIMFLIASSTAIGTTASVMLAQRHMFDADHRFVADRIRRNLVKNL